MVYIVLICSTNSNGRKFYIFWIDPFNVGDLVVLVVVRDSQANVPKAESKERALKKEQYDPEKIYFIAFCAHDLWNAR